MRRFVVPVLLAAIAVAALGVSPPGAGAGVVAQTAAGEPPAPGDVGPGTPTYAVGRRTIPVTSEPGRTVPVDVWYPADPATTGAKTVYAIPGASYTSSVAFDAPPVAAGGPFPLVVYSHGSGGQRFISAFLTEALAARGYVVAAADHLGNTALDDFTGTTKSREEIVRLRPVDIRAQIATLTSADPANPLAGRVAADRIGLVGHSAGGAGVLTTAAGRDGATVPSGLRAVVGLAAYVEPVTDAELRRIEVPTLLLSGTLDDTTPIATETVRAWKRLGSGPLVRVDLTGVGHQSYTDVCHYSDLVDARPDLAPVIKEAIKSRDDQACTERFLEVARAHEIIDRWTIGFLDRYVKGQRSAAKLLEAQNRKIEVVKVRR